MAKPAPAPIEFRAIDGSGNNKADLTLNATGDAMHRVGPAHFADGVSVPLEGPNPRDISNIVVKGDSPDNPFGFSGFMYAWGQFIDHDLDLQKLGTQDFSVHVPAGDPTLPDGSFIPELRVAPADGTGPGTGHPTAAVNTVTGWLDASMVYGSDAATAASIRGDGGHLLTSDGGNLPIVNGQFMAGDVRAAENPSLTALQTLFVREHNFQVDKLHAAHPDWDGEHLYQQARAIVGGEIANITYSEFLPKLVGKNGIDKYHGYDPHVDATITEEFAGSAFRFGHSIVSDETAKLSNDRVESDIFALKDAFFQSPAEFASDGGADGILRHLSDDLHPKMDAHIVEGLRDFLVDPPAAIDLAATNIQRQHDLGLGSLNETRVALGLKPYTSFDQITTDKATVADLKEAFGTIDKVDLWTGGISEQSMKGAELGQTFGAIVAHQFEALRDGDRLYFENALDKQTVKDIQKTTLSDLILRDTDTTPAFHLQKDVFVSFDGGKAAPKAGLVAAATAEPVIDSTVHKMDALHHFDVLA